MTGAGGQVVRLSITGRGVQPGTQHAYYVLCDKSVKTYAAIHVDILGMLL